MSVKLEPCPLCNDPMEHIRGIIRHVHQGDCLIGQLAYGEANVERWNRRFSPPTPVVAVPEGLWDRLDHCAKLLESLETLPKPYDLYYAVKKDGEGTCWSYRCAHIGVADIRAAADALAAAPEPLAALSNPTGAA